MFRASLRLSHASSTANESRRARLPFDLQRDVPKQRGTAPAIN
jgi:hypothetical protein